MDEPPLSSDSAVAREARTKRLADRLAGIAAGTRLQCRTGPALFVGRDGTTIDLRLITTSSTTLDDVIERLCDVIRIHRRIVEHEAKGAIHSFPAEGRDLALFDDASFDGLKITRMVVHEVGPKPESLKLFNGVIAPVPLQKFFLARIARANKGSAYAFKPASTLLASLKGMQTVNAGQKVTHPRAESPD